VAVKSVHRSNARSREANVRAPDKVRELPDQVVSASSVPI
jgi:hypothetical protein